MPRTRSLAWSELKIGIVSIFAVIIAAVLIFMVSGSGGFFWQRYSIKTVFIDIQGLKEGAPVRVAGVEIGSVKHLDLVGDKVEVVCNPGRSVDAHRGRLVSIKRPADGWTWGSRAGEVVE